MSKRKKRKNNLAKNLNRIMIPILIEGHGLPILNWINFFSTQYFIDMSLETLTLFDINIYLFLALHSINIWLKKLLHFSSECVGLILCFSCTFNYMNGFFLRLLRGMRKIVPKLIFHFIHCGIWNGKNTSNTFIFFSFFEVINGSVLGVS